jgi:rSAM/selenodomain-associated transferase 2
MRSRQMNRGAAEAANDTLLFLHADTTLPSPAADLVVGALESGYVFGGFRLRFEEEAVKLRFAAAMINLRTSLTRCPWGDQAQFIRRDSFLRAGGFREIPIMEDYELATRMKRIGRTIVLPETVATSGRRFLEKGLLRTAALNWRIIIRYRLGADPRDLARLYRR